MIIVINGKCVYCSKRILVHRVREEHMLAYENLVFHEGCEWRERDFNESPD